MNKYLRSRYSFTHLRRRGPLIFAQMLFYCAFCFFCFTGALSALAGAKQLYSTVGLRYANSLSAAQVESAEAYAQSAKNKDNAEFSFWGEKPVQVSGVSSGLSISAVDGIGFRGDPNACYGATYLTGSAPSVVQENSCSVSSALAWELWHSNDVIGQEVKISEGKDAILTPYHVSGVFSGNTNLILYHTPSKDSFSVVELANVPGDNPAPAVAALIQGTGLGSPFQVVYAPQILWLLSALVCTPIICLVGWAGFALLKVERCFQSGVRLLLYLVTGCAGAALLPFLLRCIPGWLIPNQWGDFKAWSAIFSAGGQQLRTWFALLPTVRDVEMKFLILKMILSLAGTFTSEILVKGIFRANAVLTQSAK